MTWKFASDISPTQRGWYVVWRMADEGEGYAPAEWNGVEHWDGAWPPGDWGIVQWWDEVFPTSAMAEVGTLRTPDPNGGL